MKAQSCVATACDHGPQTRETSLAKKLCHKKCDVVAVTCRAQETACDHSCAAHSSWSLVITCT
jgi:hypothetical protein